MSLRKITCEMVISTNAETALNILKSIILRIKLLQCSNRSLENVKNLISIFSGFQLPIRVTSNYGPEFLQLKNWLNSIFCKKTESPTDTPKCYGVA